VEDRGDKLFYKQFFSHTYVGIYHALHNQKENV